MIMFKVIKAVVGFVLGVIISIWLIIFLGVSAYKMSKPKEDFRETMTFMLRDYEKCEDAEEGVLLSCPVCKRLYQRDYDYVCCSRTCEDEYELLKTAWNRRNKEDIKLIERHGKIPK